MKATLQRAHQITGRFIRTQVGGRTEIHKTEKGNCHKPSRCFGVFRGTEYCAVST